MIELIAQTTAPANDGMRSILQSPLIMIAGLFFIMYFVMILPKRKQDKQRQNLLSNLKRGDEVQTIGGVMGKVVETRDDRVLVKVDESSNTKIWFTRTAIAKVVPEEGKTSAAK